MLKTAADILHEAAKLYEERAAEYKNNYRLIGPVMTGLFPNGLLLSTPEDHIRHHLLLLAMVKFTRYANNWTSGHPDSLRDAAVYTAMLEAVDIEIFGAKLKWHGEANMGEANKPAPPPPPPPKPPFTGMRDIHRTGMRDEFIIGKISDVGNKIAIGPEGNHLLTCNCETCLTIRSYLGLTVRFLHP